MHVDRLAQYPYRPALTTGKTTNNTSRRRSPIRFGGAAAKTLYTYSRKFHFQCRNVLTNL